MEEKEVQHQNENVSPEINEDENAFLQENVQEISIHNRPNELVTETWGNASITSVIIKK